MSFCNMKELVLERIKVLVLKEPSSDTLEAEIVNQLQDFDINKAHCYSPNEEYKLKQIISDIGIDKLQGCMTQLVPTISHQTKNYNL